MSTEVVSQLRTACMVTWPREGPGEAENGPGAEAGEKPGPHRAARGFTAIIDMVSDSQHPSGTVDALVIPVPSEQGVPDGSGGEPAAAAVWVPVSAVRYMLQEVDRQRAQEASIYEAAMLSPGPENDRPEKETP